MQWLSSERAGGIDIEVIRARFLALSAHLDERGRRLLAASEARAAGYGGIAAVSRATGLAASTIGRGLKDLSDGLPPRRVRRPGGGGKPAVERDLGCCRTCCRWWSPGHGATRCRSCASVVHGSAGWC